MSCYITKIETDDRRFPLKAGAGSDAVHTNPEYAYAVTKLHAASGICGHGITFNLGAGNDLICRAIEFMAESLVGQEIEELMSEWGRHSYRISNHPCFRWLGPHKGIVALALASISNACFDLWAKSRGVPLWKLLMDLAPEAFVDLLDLSYLEDVLSRDAALRLLREQWTSRPHREAIVRQGYPGYDTSVGWFNYDDDAIRQNAAKALDSGFTAMKLKVGSKDPARDLRRLRLLREVVGDDATLMVDANQQWTLPEALRIGLEMIDCARPYWIEEPTHPDDVLAHQTLARALAPTKIALGEHVSHRVLFKNFLQAGAMDFCQVDATRVAGIDEFLTVSMLARRFGVKVVPHVGDMGQIHQHLVLVNHVCLGHEVEFLEYIPHLAEFFRFPVVVKDGRYGTSDVPGAGCELREF